MNNRTMVKITVSEDCLSFRTISREWKSPHRFIMTKSECRKLQEGEQIILRDISSFAVLRRERNTDHITIQFHWLENCDDLLSGYRETVILPFYDAIWATECHKPGTELRFLSIIEHPQTKYTFYAKETLHAILEQRLLRKKFVRFLRDNFRWNDATEICFYSDFVPYSFFFRCTQRCNLELTGGVILHGQENMKTAKYALHT